MDLREFQMLPEVDDTMRLVKPEVGFKFLQGSKMLEQKNGEVYAGKMVSYYEVVGVGRNGSVEYKVTMERLT